MPPIFSLDLKKGLVGILEFFNGQRNVLSHGSDIVVNQVQLLSIDDHVEANQENASFL